MAVLKTIGPRAVVAAAIVCLVAAKIVAQETPASMEANVRAVFLFNFAKYVTWPPVALGERSPAEVRICVTANDSFFARLKSAVEGEVIDGKPLLRSRSKASTTRRGVRSSMLETRRRPMARRG
jgi:hypothetical protein